MVNNQGNSIKEALGQQIAVQSLDVATGATATLYQSGAVSVAIGLSSTDGAATAYTPPAGYGQIDPEAIQFVFGGTFSSETVTCTVTATYSDNSTATYQVTSTSAQTLTKGSTDYYHTLYKNNVTIKSIAVTANTTKSGSTATTLTVNIAGEQKP